MQLADYFEQLTPVQNIINQLQTEKETAQLVIGPEDSARSLLAASIWQGIHQQILIVTDDLTTAQNYFSDLKEALPDEEIHLFAVEDVFHAQMATSSPEILEQRLEALNFLSKEQPGIVITSIAGLLKPLVPKEIMKRSWRMIHGDDEIDLDQLMEQLIAMGYQREQTVARPGDFSVRGGIIDIYPLINEWPVRIELFGDEIDSIREFDPDSQRSINDIDQVFLSPATDLIVLPSAKSRAIEQLKKYHEEASMEFKKELNHQLELLNEGIITRLLRNLPGLFYQDTENILDYMDEKTLVIYDEYTHLETRSEELTQEKEAWAMEQEKKSPFISDVPLLYSFKEMQSFSQHKIYFSNFRRGLSHLSLTEIHEFHFRPMNRFFNQYPLIKEEIENFVKMEFTTLILANSDQRISEIQAMLQQMGISDIQIPKNQIQKGQLQILVGPLQKGFEWIEEKIAILTEADLFNQPKKRPVSSANFDHAEKIKVHEELSPGDYVVHINHGIGKYLGIETMEVRGVKQDYLVILYQNNDKLFVPVSQLHYIQKYVSSEGVTPKIHKLGGTRWAKTKASVSKQVEDIADDLIDLYAEREAQKGYAFSPVDDYYREFEAKFPYVETPDQLRSIEEVNRDLEKSRPMDRLLVGDVGYGKTEVAMRAAFRTVQEGKQVAFLVPTTVLAQQHYESFLERFVDFPVRIGLLSRFLTPKEVSKTLEDLKKGKLDIVIGTHRLLSKDVKFHDLGLVVVDEEQRFGVKHKERLKELKSQVDVLTLTATPIPRTLHMSIVGARDLSVIETAPQNRYPIQTYVTEMHPMIIRDAIERELARNGQVFYLHNRVQTIEQRVAFLQQLVPEARIAYAHGQMAEHQLEQVLHDFINGEYDILVTTTIIETGVDIPNVNTLLIEDADKLGLSQLYQLRGRVGRSTRIAYAYLMYKPDRVLTEESEQRLKAIQDFTELGSGFKIAMRDLSIRGAGNLLGKQQHGFIDSVGFELYSQMLAEAVAKKQGKEKERRTQLEMDFDVEAYLPEDYIPDSRQKIELYKRIRSIRGDEEYFELQDELIDRFGDYPDTVGNLLLVGLLKNYGELALIEQMKQNKNNIEVTFSEEGSQIQVPEIFKALKDLPLKTSMETNEQLVIHFSLPAKMDAAQWLDYLVDFARKIANYYETTQSEDEKRGKE